jgi:hypothetical protein
MSKISFTLLLCFSTFGFVHAQSPVDLPRVMPEIGAQTKVLLFNTEVAAAKPVRFNHPEDTVVSLFSPRTIENDQLKLVASRDWTSGKPTNTEVDVPINYADYYYLEALLRSKSPAALPK